MQSILGIILVVIRRPHRAEKLRVKSDREAMEGARALSSVEGIFGGFSSGAHAAAAGKLLEGSERGKTIAIVICDSGLKYLSTDLYS